MIANMRNSRGSAFSLIEMLVVVGVILLLAAVLYPALIKTKEWGRATRCASNLRQLHVATMNYVTENAGKFPWIADFWDDDGKQTYTHVHGWVGWQNDWYKWPQEVLNNQMSKPGNGTYAWQGASGLACLTNGSLWKYTKAQDVYVCPTFATRAVTGTNRAMRSYSMNMDAGISARMYTDTSMSATRTILYADDRSVTNSPYDGQVHTTEIGRWHGGYGQAVFVDGHVERL